MTHSTLWLAQIQFFSGLGFMLLFLVLEFGLAWVLLYLRLKARGAGRAPWMAAYRFWVRVFALALILSFAGSLPVLIQFGSLWPELLGKIGDVAAPLLAAAILSTFVFKSCFLGAMLFGMRRLSDGIHTLMVAMVAVGVSFSTFCLLSLLSWTHAPSGATLLNGQYVVIDLYQVVFNPALPWYGALFLTVSILAVAFLMMAVVCGQASRNPADEAAPHVFRMALFMALGGLVLHGAVIAGSARFAAHYQPAKAAAVAGYWDSGPRADFLLAGWPDAGVARNRLGWTLQGRGSAWLAHDGAGNWRGLDQFSGMAPPVALTFWSFRLMILLSAAMAAVALLAFLRSRRLHYDPARLAPHWRGLLRSMGFSGWLLVLASMAYIQFGAFPYAVYGTVTLSEVLAPLSNTSLLAGSLLYGGCYVALLFGFLQLLRYVARYGVIPVGRRRRRA